MNVVIIDNYDSFTYNLVHLFGQLGAAVTVLRNDGFDISEIAAFNKIVLSPGPGIPSEAGLTMEVIRKYAPTKSILGVCLGHQAIAETFGAKVGNMPDVCHGIGSGCDIVSEDRLFAGLPRHITVGRYHSWAVSPDGFPACLEITAKSDDGCIMALRHRSLDVHGIQFHPESILTPYGKQIIANWLGMR